jgi:hypothetical protein
MASRTMESFYDTQSLTKLLWQKAKLPITIARRRGPGESYSDVILRLVEMEAKGRR